MIKQFVFLLLCSCFLMACGNEAKENAAAVKVEEAKLEAEAIAKAEADSIKADSVKMALALAERVAEEEATKKAEEEKEKEKVAAAKLAAKKKAAAKAKANRKAKAKASSKKPVIAWERKTHNFGLIQQGESVTRKFYFINEGTEPLVIKDATATCGCTRPGFPFVPIKPGEESYVSVTFNSKGKYGDQEPTVTVVTNASPSTHILKMKGKIDAELEVADPVIPVSENGQ